MTKLHTQNAPDISVVKPHFLFGAFAFGVAVLLMLLSGTELFLPYYHNKILAIIHTNILGWAMMLVYGSLYQLVPVVFETKLYSEILAKITFWLTGFSIIIMAYAFWTGKLDTWLVWGAYLMYTALFLFVFNISMSYKNATLKNIKTYFIIAAIFWLFLTQTEGLLMALSFKYGVYSNNLTHLPVHAVMGLAGFFLQMIFGVGTTLVPMFLVSHKHSEKPLIPSFVLYNAGLSILVINWWFIGYRPLIWTGWILMVAGAGFYLKFVYDAYRNRFKRILDEGMQPTILMFILLVIPVLTSFILLFQKNNQGEIALMLTTLFGFSMIFGVINLIILGQTYKTIPFIIWLERYQPYVGKYKIPLPKEVYNARLAIWQFRFYLVFLNLFIFAIIVKSSRLLWMALLILGLVAISYNVNMIKMFFHKPHLEPLEKNK